MITTERKMNKICHDQPSEFLSAGGAMVPVVKISGEVGVEERINGLDI